jgi:hypothetical protein
MRPDRVRVAEGGGAPMPGRARSTTPIAAAMIT